MPVHVGLHRLALAFVLGPLHLMMVMMMMVVRVVLLLLMMMMPLMMMMRLMRMLLSMLMICVPWRIIQWLFIYFPVLL